MALAASLWNLAATSVPSWLVPQTLLSDFQGGRPREVGDAKQLRAEGRDMRWTIMAFALAAAPAVAQDPVSTWQYYEPDGGTMQAGVVNAQGAQLILKCDKPGKGQVFAVVVTPEKQVPPSNQPFITRALEVRFDAEAPIEDRWRYYENSVVAIDQKPTIALTRFLNGLADASKLRVRTNPERARYVEAEFDVAGAREAIGRVYASCEDSNPLG
jgi:hypothetical protein